MHWDDCKDDGEMIVTHNWLILEFIYQYTQVLVYFLTNCTVIGIMLFMKNKEREEKMKAIESHEAQKSKKKS